MDTTLKQRILGIIVLVALLGICLSVLLHRDKNGIRAKAEAATKTTPAIVNTTSSLLNSSNSANMTPANTNVFANNNDQSQAQTTTPSDMNVFNTNQTSSQNTANTQVIPPAQQNVTSSQSITPAQQNVTTSQTTAQTSSALSSNLNNEVSSATVASASIKPITPPPSNSNQAIPSSNSQMTSSVASITPATNQTSNNLSQTSNIASANEDDAVPGDNTDSVTVAKPSAAKSIPISTKTSTHQKSVSTTSAPTHKKSKEQHTTVITPVSTSDNTTVSNNSIDQQKDLVVQVGSFNLPANAQTLVDKLHTKGFTASTQKVETASGEMTRVIVGKKGLDHTQVETLRTQLQSEMQLQGFVTPHDISGTSSKPSVKSPIKKPTATTSKTDSTTNNT